MHGVPRERWGGNGHRDPISKYVATRLGLKSAIRAEKLMRSAPQDTAAIIEELFARGAESRALLTGSVVVAALERIRPQSVDALLQVAQDADAFEESPESAYRMHRCRETRRAWLHKLHRQYITTLQLIVALKAEDQADMEVPA
jgi:hypothetical protein